MAMVLDAFASYLQGMLSEMVADEIHLLLGVSVEIDKMACKLKDLKNFLTDADRRSMTDVSVQAWVAELKRAMYDATDILDDCQLKAMERGESSVDAGCYNPLLFLIRNPFHAHDIGSRIKSLNQRLDAIEQCGDNFRFINLGSYEDHRRNMRASRHGNPSRETSAEFYRSGMVGEKIEEDTKALVAEILQTHQGVNNIMVFAIVGMGGIGKTTLAQNVFINESIQNEFDKKIWLSINQNFDKTELLRTAITLACGDHCGEKNLAVLQVILTKALKGKKFFLVMDDLWSHGAWERVLMTPLVNAAASGSRVLITTRDEAVARGMRAKWPHHHIDALSPDDAWSLLKNQVVSSETDEYQVNKLKDIGLKIIQTCGGLPLAIIVMGGVLCQTEMQRHDWEKVLDDSKCLTKMPEDLNNAVYLSYENMPPYLKQCFLYYSLLPKSNSFQDLHVIGMWIGEGFIQGNYGDLEELGRSYYKELMSRNLIQLVDFKYGQSHCSMHDVVRSFGQYMAKSEAFVAHSGEIDILDQLNSKKFLRLSIETDNVQSGDFDWKCLQEQQSMRTLISNVEIKMEPGGSLVTSSSLRTLYVQSADVAVVESLHQFKHLRYFNLKNDDISSLPGNIGKMKFLQYLDVNRCQNLVNLPDSIVKLVQLRYLNLPENGSMMIPRGFHGLTDMRILGGFPALIDGDWCSLDELGPLFQLRFLGLVQLENASSAANARISEKNHLINLLLYCTAGQEHNEDAQQRIEEVFNQLCPPPSIKNIDIYGYFGQKLPSWMMSTTTVPLNNLKFLLLSRLACCTQLPDGLCLLPCLQVLKVDGAPCIKRVGTEFLCPSQLAAVSFPRLSKMVLKGMVEWEEWEWEEKVQAMPRLEELSLKNCKLGRVPPGLASNSRALRKLSIKKVKQISCLESFPSVVELTVVDCPDLGSISNLHKLQKLDITSCPKLKSVEDVPALQRLVLEDGEMETLPGYLREVQPRYLELGCSLTLLTSIAAGKSGPEFAKFSLIDHVKAKGLAYASDWYVLYTKMRNSLDTNVNMSFLSEGTQSISQDAQRLESALKMPRRAFDYICSLVKDEFLQLMNKYTFFDGRWLCLEDQVAIALIVLNSGETPATVGSSVAVNEATVLQVTTSFVDAMHRPTWPGTDEIEKIKYKFDKMYGLPNCCGVLHTTRISFGSDNHWDHEKNVDLLMQVVIDSDMRFTNVELGLSGGEDQLTISKDSMLFSFCQDGRWMNGSKLMVPSGGEVGEYIIGDVRYHLMPWLLTPYKLEDDLSDSRLVFNKRHSEATAVTQNAFPRLKDTWKFLHGGGWCPYNQHAMQRAIKVCCTLHNILTGMEEDACMSSSHKVNRSVLVREVAYEDAVMCRDKLSMYLTEDSNIRSYSSSPTAGNDEDAPVGADSSSKSAESVFGEAEPELVGIDSPQEHLIKMLHLKDRKLKMVSICGTGGLGKTAIAKVVCRKIENQFHCRAFVLVSHEPDIKKIIRDICDQVGSDCPDNEESDVRQQGIALSQFLQNKRYLIVFDNVWTVKVWNEILDSLKVTSENHGSRIIITTRMVDVAEHVGGLYYLPLLSGNDSKMLFYRRTYFGSEDNCPSQFKELSKRMLSKCGQLPLAIIVITKLLSESKVLGEWQNACSSIEKGGMENIRTVLKHSYDHLPEVVKPCLLYLSIFPEGCEIGRDGLVKRWIAEHLIPGDDGQNLQQLGESYFSELVNSSMIQQIESDSFLKDLVYSIHVTTLDLIVSLSIKEDFVTILAGMQRSHLQQKIGRLSLQVSNEHYDVLKETKTVGGVSSLSVFCGTDFIQPVSKFQGLHVLDLEKCDSLENVHLNGLRKLYKLRYLALGSSHITVVPPKIWKLKHLQTLDLTATSVTQLPSSIAKLTQLRRLLINRSTEVPGKIIKKLQALEELVEIDISKSPSILEGISTMAGLRVLSIGMWLWDEHSSTLLSDALCKLSTQKLKRLSISTCCLLDLKPDLQPVLEQLEELEIQDRTFNPLPILIGQLNNLRFLSIEVYTLEKDALQTLGKLSQLLFLSLTAKRTAGEELVVVSEKFSSLKTFLLFNHAMRIKFEQGAMERLERLKLTLQATLTKYFWFGLENLSSLKHVQVEIICFSATDGVVYKAEDAIESMIGENPNNPTLEIKRTVKEYMIKDKIRACEMKAEDEDQEAGRKDRVPEQRRRVKKKNRRY